MPAQRRHDESLLVINGYCAVQVRARQLRRLGSSNKRARKPAHSLDFSGSLRMPGEVVDDVLIHQVEPFRQCSQHRQSKRFGRREDRPPAVPRGRDDRAKAARRPKSREPRRSAAGAGRTTSIQRRPAPSSRVMTSRRPLRQNSLDRRRALDQERKMIVGLILRQQNRRRRVPGPRPGRSRSPSWSRGRPRQAMARP